MIPLSLSLAGLTFPSDPSLGTDTRRLVAWASSVDGRAVQLDATMPGVRARELDRSARRDLASLIRRHGLALSGLDLFIPPAHFASPAHADRAVAATIGTIELGAELATLVGGTSCGNVSLSLPPAVPPEVGAALTSASGEASTILVDYCWPPHESPAPGLRVGIDSAQLLLADADPSLEIARCATKIGGVRVGDASTHGRVPLGSGRLDIPAFKTSAAIAGVTRATLDLRGISDADAVARASVQIWDRST